MATVAKQPPTSPRRAQLERLISFDPDIPSSLLGDQDRSVVKHARDVIANATMAEILNEDPQGPLAFRDAVCQQITALCVCLRISLVIVDKLMALKNENPK